MGKASRSKGNTGELEVRRLYEAHGFTVRGLEGAGDHLALGHGLTIFSEVKRCERWEVQEWLRQTWTEAPNSTLPVLALRGNRWPWVAAVPLDSLLGSLTREFRTFERA